MSDLSNDTKKHTTKSRETIPLRQDQTLFWTFRTQSTPDFSSQAAAEQNVLLLRVHVNTIKEIVSAAPLMPGKSSFSAKSKRFSNLGQCCGFGRFLSGFDFSIYVFYI
jgi:hypothetical protein